MSYIPSSPPRLPHQVPDPATGVLEPLAPVLPATLTATGLTATLTLTTPTHNVSVDWGDGTVEVDLDGGVMTHTYAKPGTYLVSASDGARANVEEIVVSATTRKPSTR